MSSQLLLSVSDGRLVEVRFGGPQPLFVSCPLRLDGVEFDLSEPASVGRATVDISVQGNKAKRQYSDASGPVALVEDDYFAVPGLLSIRRRWKLLRPGTWNLGISFLVRGGADDAEIFVPGVLYRGNAMGKGSFPKRALAPVWSFLENRTPLPNCVQIRDGSVAMLCSAEPAKEPALLGAAEAVVSQGRWTVNIDVPGREGPYAYTGKSSLVPADPDRRPGLKLDNDEAPAVFERTFYCRLAPCGGNSLFGSYREFVEALPPRPSANGGAALVSWEDYKSLKFAHLLSLVESAPDGEGACLAMGRGNGALQEVYRYTAGSFLVKSIEGAWILARSGDPDGRALALLRRLSSSPLELAERVGRFFLKGEQNAGVHQDCYDLRRGVWGGYLGISEHDAFRYQVNARCNGEVMKAYVLLYQALKARGREVPEFIELPRRVARFYLDRQLGGTRAGSFGRWWSVDGKEIDSLGTNGAYVASFLIAAAPYLQDLSGLDAAIEAAGAYYASLAREGEFFGDTLDADSCDKEAGAALLALFMDLHEREGTGRWIGAARDAAEFLLSWVWQYDVAFPPDSLLGSRGFSTRGMTSVSIAHHHLDFYGMAIAYDFLRYARATGDVFFEDQAVAMLRSCRQLVAGEADPLGRPSSDLGWQPEQLNHTDWDYFDRPECRNGFFDIDIAWVSVLGLGAYERIAERFPEALERSGRQI
jgi:hypothetical protein